MLRHFENHERKEPLSQEDQSIKDNSKSLRTLAQQLLSSLLQTAAPGAFRYRILSSNNRFLSMRGVV